MLLVREFEPLLFEPVVYFNIKCIGILPGPTKEFEQSLVFKTGEFERPKFDCILILHESSRLLNLLKELGKRDKMGGLPSILSVFRNDLINSIIQEHEY